MTENQYFNPHDVHRYDDMLHLPHHVSTHHPPMTLTNRAAQFSPFAALTGYDAELEEAGRRTDRRVELSECERALLDERLHLLQTWLSRIPGKWAAHTTPDFTMPEVTITYFVPDGRKEGGAYTAVTGTVRRIDPIQRTLLMADGTAISMEDVVQISSDAFDALPLSNPCPDALLF